MVFGDSYTERAFAATARRELAPYASRLRLEFTTDLSFTEVQEKAAHLGPDSVVFFGIFSSDVNGVSLPRYSGLSVVSAVSKVPVFGPFDDQLGKGIIGGSLIQSTKIGEEIAAAAQDLLSGQSDTGAVRRVELSEPTYDWRELEAWGIDLDTLPPGSTILFQPAGIWKQFRVWIVLAAIIFLSQSILLLTLLHQSRRRREAEIARESLSRRLITVQENERRLIARELHDDLSQRLARATLDVSFVRSGPAGPATEEVLKQLHPDLVKISKDIHDMSYRMHPSLVEDLGIAAAFRSEIDRAQRRTDAKITARIGEISEHLPDEKALSIFRIGQEALQNAIKHADAATIEITLEPRGHGLKLIVQDDGAGFDVTDKQAKFSIGLSSMKERTHLVNGVLNIRSRPGKGTTVTLSVAGKAGSI
jgi:signal transduction histidine kinase